MHADIKTIWSVHKHLTNVTQQHSNRSNNLMSSDERHAQLAKIMTLMTGHTSGEPEWSHSRRPVETPSLSTPAAEEWWALQARIWQRTCFHWHPLTSAIQGAASADYFQPIARLMIVSESRFRPPVWHSLPVDWPVLLQVPSFSVSFCHVQSVLPHGSSVSWTSHTVIFSKEAQMWHINNCLLLKFAKTQILVLNWLKSQFSKHEPCSLWCVMWNNMEKLTRSVMCNLLG